MNAVIQLQISTQEKSASSKKIPRDIRSDKDVEDNPECYIFINTEGIIDLIGVCPSCKSAHYNTSRKRGQANLLSITCPDWVIESSILPKKLNKNDVTQEGGICLTLIYDHV